MNQEILSLCQAYQKYFDIGAAISPPSLTMHADLLKKHFNSITCENQMKYEPMHPAEDKWIFEPADQLSPLQRKTGCVCACMRRSGTIRHRNGSLKQMAVWRPASSF